jgi:hypothetical protein
VWSRCVQGLPGHVQPPLWQRPGLLGLRGEPRIVPPCWLMLAGWPTRQLETELEQLGSGHNADLIEGQLDALWTQTRSALESLALIVLLLVSCDPPVDTREE